ncbi:cobW-domain-containing protein [Thelephora ganbajun]|uniref:CobW-domain-containing protein n=1 Tax=Thelephora ganbajun TaxID=370292 RepID=A0ACB6ZLH7_THEGA|nr:cobW-domain-containing protein [Thelephora ganbajun]
MAPISVTVFTGFLGAGKTSLILKCLPQLPRDYKVVLLKNEFGDVQVDSQLARQSNLSAVSEILNGCMCCVLVGQMRSALLEIQDTLRPDRIIIECSGSAFPATLAFQLRELERETGGDIKMDAIITVIDAENFMGYEDTSPTARMQASYTDLLVINKWEGVSERQLDIVFDHLHTLNDLTPKVKASRTTGVDLSLLFGLDSKLFREPIPDECGEEGHDHLGVRSSGVDDTKGLERSLLLDTLDTLSKETIWRVKGFVRLLPENQVYVLNWAFGRYELNLCDTHNACPAIQLTVMGQRGEMKRLVHRFAERLRGNVCT